MKTTHYIGFDVHKKHINFCRSQNHAQMPSRTHQIAQRLGRPSCANTKAKTLRAAGRGPPLAVAWRLERCWLSTDDGDPDFPIRIKSNIPPFDREPFDRLGPPGHEAKGLLVDFLHP